jgi:hypothetical protein
MKSSVLLWRRSTRGCHAKDPMIADPLCLESIHLTRYLHFTCINLFVEQFLRDKLGVKASEEENSAGDLGELLSSVT